MLKINCLLVAFIATKLLGYLPDLSHWWGALAAAIILGQIAVYCARRFIAARS